VTIPPGWLNPIVAAPGGLQSGVRAADLLPSRHDLNRARLDAQLALLASNQPRWTPIQVTADGVLWDGHHGARAAAENGANVDVQVVNAVIKPVGLLLLDLPVR
jgi:hypothetical protein